jgi:MFS family permease
LYVGYFTVGATTAGFQLAQFNLMIRLAPATLRPAYVAVFLALTSLLTAAGPLLGGEMLQSIPLQIGNLFGQPILSFHLLFGAAALGCALITNLMQRVHEPAEQPIINVWREMKGMRSFNPMLSMLSVGQLLLTPRGLLALGRRSLRSVRYQVKAIEAVGEEIVSGGREVLKNFPEAKNGP